MCNECGCVFDNPQALGGHCKQHAKMRGIEGSFDAAAHNSTGLDQWQHEHAEQYVKEAKRTNKAMRLPGNKLDSRPHITFKMDGKPMKRVLKKRGTKYRVQFQTNQQYLSLIWDTHGQTIPPRRTGTPKAWATLKLSNINMCWDGVWITALNNILDDDSTDEVSKRPRLSGLPPPKAPKNLSTEGWTDLCEKDAEGWTEYSEEDTDGWTEYSKKQAEGLLEDSSETGSDNSDHMMPRYTQMIDEVARDEDEQIAWEKVGLLREERRRLQESVGTMQTELRTLSRVLRHTFALSVPVDGAKTELTAISTASEQQLDGRSAVKLEPGDEETKLPASGGADLSEKGNTYTATAPPRVYKLTAGHVKVEGVVRRMSQAAKLSARTRHDQEVVKLKCRLQSAGPG